MSELDLIKQITHLQRQVDGLIKPEVGRWVDWTPTVTQLGAVTVTVNWARYITIGDLAVVGIRLTVTGSGTAGNNIIIGGQPVAIQAANNANVATIGTGIVFDSGTAVYHGALSAQSATDWRMFADGLNNAIGTTPSFGLVAGDVISLQAAYERA